LKILFLIDSLQCGGKERQFVELVCGLKNSGESGINHLAVITMAAASHFDGTLEAAGIRIIRGIRRYQFDPLILFKLRNIFKEFKPDIIHNFSLMTTIYTIFTPKPKKTNIVDGSIRNAFPTKGIKERIFRKISAHLSDLIIANSHAGLDAKHAPLKKSIVLYNGFDLKRIGNLRSAEEMREELGIGPGSIVGMVAGFSKKKDWDTFFKSAKLVRQKRPDVIFLAVGDGPTLQNYKNAFQRTPGIVFTGRRTDVENLIQLFDVGVLCSNREGIPNSVMEYMALGKPVVVTDGGGIRELIVDGQTGYIIPASDPNDLAVRILELLDAPKTALDMGMKGRMRITENFSMEKIIHDLFEIYSQIKVK